MQNEQIGDATAQNEKLVLPKIFADHMVLQRHKPIPVWGKAGDSEEVSVEFMGRRKTVKAVSGRWRMELDPAPAGGPHGMTISCEDSEIAIRDIMIGEVWIAGGQSNMGYSFREIYGEETAWMVDAFNDDDFEGALSGIRLFKVEEYAADEPADDVRDGQWREVSRERMLPLAAVPVFFACALKRRLNVPVGIVQVSRSGTKASCWIPRSAACSAPAISMYREEFVEEEERLGRDDLRRPFGLYNGMVSPIQPYAMCGVIWYQGESDALEQKGRRYGTLFPALLQAWRSGWGGEAFPFLYVELPDYVDGLDEWELVRTAQNRTLELVSNTGMIATRDLGEADNLHPRNKRPVGERLAALAMKQVYGVEAAGKE